MAFGTLKTKYIQEFTDLTRREFFILLSLLIPMVVLGLTSSFVLDFVHLPVKLIVSPDTVPVCTEIETDTAAYYEEDTFLTTADLTTLWFQPCTTDAEFVKFTISVLSEQSLFPIDVFWDILYLDLSTQVHPAPVVPGAVPNF